MTAFIHADPRVVDGLRDVAAATDLAAVPNFNLYTGGAPLTLVFDDGNGALPCVPVGTTGDGVQVGMIEFSNLVGQVTAALTETGEPCFRFAPPPTPESGKTLVQILPIRNGMPITNQAGAIVADQFTITVFPEVQTLTHKQVKP